MERTAKMEERRGNEEYKRVAYELWRNGRKTTIISYFDAQVVTLAIRRRIFFYLTDYARFGKFGQTANNDNGTFAFV